MWYHLSTIIIFIYLIANLKTVRQKREYMYMFEITRVNESAVHFDTCSVMSRWPLFALFSYKSVSLNWAHRSDRKPYDPFIALFFQYFPLNCYPARVKPLHSRCYKHKTFDSIDDTESSRSMVAHFKCFVRCVNSVPTHVPQYVDDSVSNV